LPNKLVYKTNRLFMVVFSISISLFTFVSFIHADGILKISKLDKEIKELTINRDIFSPDTMKPRSLSRESQRPIAPPPPKIEKPKPMPQPETNIEDEIRRSLFFEGYVIKHPKNFALVSSNGEFFAVGAGDIILERIKIIKIDKETITVEVDSRAIEIQLKGDDSDDQ
jgi:hypothetical protein